MQLQRAYQRAVEDAYDIQPDEIHHELWAITPDNPQLIWRKSKGQQQVLMVTWTSWDGYGDRLGQKMDLGREIWVTAVPELRQFASQLDLSPKSLSLRLPMTKRVMAITEKFIGQGGRHLMICLSY